MIIETKKVDYNLKDAKFEYGCLSVTNECNIGALVY